MDTSGTVCGNRKPSSSSIYKQKFKFLALTVAEILVFEIMLFYIQGGNLGYISKFVVTVILMKLLAVGEKPMGILRSKVRLTKLSDLRVIKPQSSSEKTLIIQKNISSIYLYKISNI